MNGHRLRASDVQIGEVTFSAARGEMTAEALAIWFRQRMVPLSE